jgi:DNA-binding transcriptional regulator YhcF (GntR family)
VKTSKTDEKLIIKARTMYVFGIEKDGKHILPSIRDVARALGLNFRTLQERAVKEKWHEERTRTYRAISKEVKNRLMAEYVESNFKIRSSMVEACLLGVKLIQSRLAQVAVAAREQGVSAVPTKQAAVQSWEMRDLAAALETLRRIVSDVMGDEVVESTITWQDVLRQAVGDEG